MKKCVIQVTISDVCLLTNGIAKMWNNSENITANAEKVTAVNDLIFSRSVINGQYPAKMNTTGY